MKLLITGGLGFIGSNFIRYILNKPCTFQEQGTAAQIDKVSLERCRVNIPNTKSL